MHVRLWAAGDMSKAPFIPLEKDVKPHALREEAVDWGARVKAAQVALQSEMAAAVSVLQAAKQHPGTCDSESEAASAAVLCAAAFEVLGSVSGLLPPGGWKKAVRLFSHCMVRAIICRVKWWLCRGHTIAVCNHAKVVACEACSSWQLVIAADIFAQPQVLVHMAAMLFAVYRTVCQTRFIACDRSSMGGLA